VDRGGPTPPAVDRPNASPPATDVRVSVDEPPLPRRTRRPYDTLRLFVLLVAMVGLIALAIVAERTLTGLTSDVAALSTQLPDGPIDVLSFVSSLVGLLVPPALVVMLMLRGRLRMTAEVLAAGVVAAVAAALVSQLLEEPLATRVESVFVPVAQDASTAIPAYPALLVAIVTVVSRLNVSRLNMRRLRQATLFAIVGSFAVGLLGGFATVGGTLVSIAIGSIVGFLVRLVSGQPTSAPTGRTVAQTLREHGYDVTALRTENTGSQRRYIAVTPQRYFEVLVLDRDEEGAASFRRLMDSVRTRGEVLARTSPTLRDAIDRTALLSLGTAHVGVRTPELHDVVRIGSDAAALIYDHVPSRVLAGVPTEEITDEILDDLWHQLALLRQHEIAHRHLVDTSILLSDDGKVWLIDSAGGELAAPHLALRTDLAQAMVTMALVVGPDRTVSTAMRTLGSETVGQTVAVLQRVALALSTRRALRERRSLLTELRTAILRTTGSEVAETVQLRRVRPWSLVTGIAAAAAFYLVGTQLTDVDVNELASQSDWRWVVVALVSVFLSYIGASFALLGFVPERVPFGRTLAAQISLSFLRLVAPSAVGNVAVNIRLLTRAGVDGPLAAASVAANQVGNVAVTVPLVALFAVVSGSSAAANLEPSPRTITIALAAVATLGLLTLIPRVRVWIGEVWRNFAERGLPRLFDVLSNPHKLSVAIGGIVLQLLALVMCFYASVRAVGTTVDFTALAVVQLVGNTIGMAVPTPGGLGAVEAALSAGIGTIGVGGAYALPAVLLFRFISFWLPIVPGWILWTQLQRRNLV